MASAAEQLARNLNFSTFSKAKALQQRIWFTLGALLVYRLGTFIPVPGIDPDAFRRRSNRASRVSSACSTCSPAVPSSAWRSSR